MVAPEVRASDRRVKPEPPCVRCGSAVIRDGKGHRRCPVCRTASGAEWAKRRSAEYRRRERQRAAERAGKSYTPGVPFWVASPSSGGKCEPSDFHENRWRLLEVANARQAWQWWLDHAPTWWRMERAEFIREERNARFRSRYADRAEHERIRVRAYKHSHAGIAAGWGDRRWQRIAETADGSVSAESLSRLLRQRGACPYCGEPVGPGNSAVDHMDPVAKGGGHSLGNILIVCRPCNMRKSDRPWRAWLAMLDEPHRSTCERTYRARRGDTERSV